MMAGGFETGGSQFNGGGIMTSPAAHDGPGSAQKKAYDQQSQSVRRLTIKQLHDGVEGSAADGVMVDGKEVSNVRCPYRYSCCCESILVMHNP